jgi:hypothetical protein
MLELEAVALLLLGAQQLADVGGDELRVLAAAVVPLRTIPAQYSPFSPFQCSG